MNASRFRETIVRLIAGLALMLAAASAAAQEAPDYVATEEVGQAVTADKAPEGWRLKLSLGSNAALNHNSKVVGNTDGSTFQFGLVLDGGADYRLRQHEWRNTLSVRHTQTKTPQIDDFVKTADELYIESMYLYSLESVPWLGPFGRARLRTSLFPGYYVAAEDSQLDTGAGVEDVAAQERFELTASFEPLVLRQSAGVFARPYDDKTFHLEFSFGLGAQEVFTSDGFNVTDADVAPIALARLEDSKQAGAELEAGAKGELNTAFAWAVSANLLYPFIVSDDQGLDGLDLLNTELSAKLSAKLSKWASIDYVLSAKKLPLVLDEWQVQNGVLLSAAFNLL